MAFKTETHCHTSETSPCSGVKGRDLARIYKEKGYDTIIVTDHYRGDTVFQGKDDLTSEEKIDNYLKGFYDAKDEGEKIGLNVIFGIELCFSGTPEDFLVYGVTRDFLIKYPDLFNMERKEVRKLCDENGMLFFQAHPFREYLTRADVELLHGVEAYNAHPWHNSHNDEAEKYADKHNLMKLSGSDCHAYEHAGRGGIITEEPITSIEQFIDIVKNGKYELIKAE